jgi:hypothetical protein
VGRNILPGKKTAVGLSEESMVLRAALYLVRQYPGVESSQRERSKRERIVSGSEILHKGRRGKGQDSNRAFEHGIEPPNLVYSSLNVHGQSFSHEIGKRTQEHDATWGKSQITQSCAEGRPNFIQRPPPSTRSMAGQLASSVGKIAGKH